MNSVMQRLRATALCAVISTVIMAGPQVAADSSSAGGPAPDPVSLVRAVLISINDANQSGNYTVLRELGAASFQRRSAGELAQMFAPLRNR